MDEKERQQLRAKMETLYSHAEEVLAYLRGRWQDEREFEDFADYEDLMRKLVDSLGDPDITFVKGVKRPFGFRVVVLGYTVLVYVTADKIGAKVVQ